MWKLNATATWLIAAVIGGLVLIRLVRWWRERRNGPVPVPPTGAAAAAGERRTAAAVSEHNDAAAALAFTPAVSYGMAMPPAAAGWFTSRRAAVAPLPRVEAAETGLVPPDDYLFGPVTPLLASLLPETAARQAEIKKELAQAGFHQPHALQNLSAARYLCLMAPLLALGTLLLFVPARLEGYVIGTMVMGGLLGWALPRLYVRNRAAERRSEIERSLPDVIDMINMCVSQGMTLPAALDRVQNELRRVYPALSEELRIVAEQARIGSLEQALQNFHERVEINDVKAFTTLLIQTERMGTSITAALADYSERMRESLRQRADAKANRATFQLLFPTVLCLMPAVYMFLLGPSIIELSDFFGGENAAVEGATNAVEEYNRIRTQGFTEP